MRLMLATLLLVAALAGPAGAAPEGRSEAPEARSEAAVGRSEAPVGTLTWGIHTTLDSDWRKTPHVKWLVFRSMPDEGTRAAALTIVSGRNTPSPHRGGGR